MIFDNDYLDNDYSNEAYGDNSEWVRQYYLEKMKEERGENE